MIHVKDTTLASRAVVASLYLNSYLSGLKLWQSKQYLRLRLSVYYAKNPQYIGTRPGSPIIDLIILQSSMMKSRWNTMSIRIIKPGRKSIR